MAWLVHNDKEQTRSVHGCIALNRGVVSGTAVNAVLLLRTVYLFPRSEFRDFSTWALTSDKCSDGKHETTLSMLKKPKKNEQLRHSCAENCRFGFHLQRRNAI